MQTFFWIELIKGHIKRPLPPPHYHLLVRETARIKYAIDHGTYMSTLAKDIGAAPGLFELWWQYGSHVLLCYWYAFHYNYHVITSIIAHVVLAQPSPRSIAWWARIVWPVHPKSSKRNYGKPLHAEVLLETC